MATLRRAVGHGASLNAHGEIFPALGAFVGCGMLGGLAASGVTGVVMEQSAGVLSAHGALSACLGAIMGLFLGLGRAVFWNSGNSSRLQESVDPSHRLWDPWLDSGSDVDQDSPSSESASATREDQAAQSHPATVLPGEKARVRPRVISPVTGEALPLDDTIGQLIQDRQYKLVGLVGGPGAGKSMALRHLGAVLPPWALAHLKLVDDPEGYADVVAFFKAENCQLVISAGCQMPPAPHQVVYRLASWSQDDLIEYLLSAQWDRCASVMSRLKTSDDRGFLKGIPELWTAVLDRMAADESICDVRAGLRGELAKWFEQYPHARAVVEDFCLTAVGQNDDLVLNLPVSMLSGDMPKPVRLAEEMLRLIRHRPVGLLLAADRLKYVAECGQVDPIFTRRFPHDLVREAALAIGGNSVALRHLREWLENRELRALHPMAVSLLVAVTPRWRPHPDCRPNLKGAYLTGAAWSGLNLAHVDLESADFKEADLSRTNFTQSNANRARFQRAKLREALLDSWVAVGADLQRADLHSVSAVGANFRQANLSGACLVDATFWKADLREAKIEGADFTGANLEDADLKGLKLRQARFDHARFGGADLQDCDLEEMVLTVPDFHDANLRGALFTGSRMQEANFVGANLRCAGLAEVDWPGADLSDADLRGASFHLGSSRSGLVGSPIACEGSRTGFYTDDYDEQDIKPAEEIRKANLGGADLRGANIEGVDFYLVDLRGAKYTRDQAEHFRQCRAILEDRLG